MMKGREEQEDKNSKMDGMPINRLEMVKDKKPKNFFALTDLNKRRSGGDTANPISKFSFQMAFLNHLRIAWFAHKA